MTTTNDLRDALLAAYDAVERPWSSESFAGLMDDLIDAVRDERSAEVAALERDLATFAAEPDVQTRIANDHVAYWYNQTRLVDAKVERLSDALRHAWRRFSTFHSDGPAMYAIEHVLSCDCGSDQHLVERGPVQRAIRAALAQTPPTDAGARVDPRQRRESVGGPAIAAHFARPAPAPITEDALAAALRKEGVLWQMAQRYGRPNDAYYQQAARAILAAIREGTR